MLIRAIRRPESHGGWTILPEITLPFAKQLKRIHKPEPWNSENGWRGFRVCLRWEFGFTCAVCQLHEADLVPPTTTIDGHSIEHAIPQSSELGKEDADEYDNCYWVCARCNETRGKKPLVNESGSRLLNPITDVWADHFVRTGHELCPNAGDLDANILKKLMVSIWNTAWDAKWRSSVMARAFRDINRLLDEIRTGDNEFTLASTEQERETLLRKRGSLAKDFAEDLEKVRHYTGIPQGAPGNFPRCEADKAIDPEVSSQWRSFTLPTLPDSPVPSKRRFRQ